MTVYAHSQSTIVSFGSQWKYYDQGNINNSQWHTNSYSDASWQQGNTEIGYGDGDENTTVGFGPDATNKYPTTYFRKTINLSSVSTLDCRVKADDGVVVYCNGVEVFRGNMPTGTVAYNTYASSSNEGTMFNFTIQPNLVTIGNNLIAVEIHQFNSGSSDISFDFESVSNAPFSSNLPIVLIDTRGGTIVDEPKILAELKIIDNGSSARNYITDTVYHYNGLMGIEIRGGFSQSLPKKNYGIELRADTLGTDLNFPLLGMPSESDWVLTANYLELTYTRNLIMYDLAQRTGQYAPLNRFCEVFINGEYRGLYQLGEKIKRDVSRVNIKKLTTAPTDTILPRMSGGYIIENNHDDAVPDSIGWTSSNHTNNASPYKTFEIVTPSEVTPQQRNYIRNYFMDFENALLSTNFSDSLTGFRNYINENSFWDFIIFQEFCLNNDAYYRSNFFYKDRNQKIVAGPLWDFDASFGTGFFRYQTPYAWRISMQSNPKMFWFGRMMEDCKFMNNVIERYTELRTNVLKYENMVNLIDSVDVLISEAKQRDRDRWFSTPPEYETGNLDSLKSWIQQRLTWMDKNIYSIVSPAPTLSVSATNINANSSVTLTASGCTGSTRTWNYKFPDFESSYTTSTNSTTISTSFGTTFQVSCDYNGCIRKSAPIVVNVINNCPTNIAITNQIVSPALVRNYSASQQTTISSAVSGVKLDLNAGNSVMFLPGFTADAKQNAIIKAEIKNCPN